MNVDDPADPMLPPPREGHHRSARERQRKGPMWGCLRTLFFVIAGVLLLLLLVVGGGWWYLGTTSFEDLVRLRIEKTLEARLGREVTIGSVQITRSRPQRVILNDIRIANAPGGISRYFATVRQVEISGGIESFWRRSIRVGRVDIREPHLWFEIFPEGSPLVHNFPKWQSGPARQYEIVHLELGQLFVSSGAFDFLDRKHEITARATGLASRVNITRAEELYEGLITSPMVRVAIQDYEPFDLKMRGGFRYTPGAIALRSVALEGRGIETFLSGKIAPLSESAYDLRLTSRLALPRVREIFRLEQALEGSVSLDTQLVGKEGTFELKGGWTTPMLAADPYELTNVRGRLSVSDQRATIDVERASYGGGTIGAHYLLEHYAEPYPMRVGLRYDGISIEQLFADWGVQGIGLRAGATGNLDYRWEKDRLLDGTGTGKATLTRSSLAFSDARYPIPVAGSTDFALDRGVVRFRSAALDTGATHVDFTGSLRIEEVVSDLKLAIRSSDFSELDRIGFNLAHSAGKNDYELLGLGGAGTIDGTLAGPIDAPEVHASISATGARFNDVNLGDAAIALAYDGRRSVMTFERARFTEANGWLALTGTLSFPEKGPSPLFDIAAEAEGYPAQRAIDAMGLDLKIGSGLATGKLLVTGSGESGRATFVDLKIRRGDATLALNGTLNWLPGEGNVVFDLRIAATNFPIADVASFLDLGDLPVRGDVTGTLDLRGRKEELEGGGSIVVRNGAILDEPIELASADIAFSKGRMRATNLLLRSQAGEIRGEAEMDLANETFSYSISSSSIDLSRIGLLSTMRDLLGGRLVLSSTGAGTFDNPELVVEATLEDATVRGLALPEGSAPPSLYLAIRGGRLVIRGSVADLVTIEGDGLVGEKLAVDGNVRIKVPDLARALALSPSTASFPASGSLELDLRLLGALSPIEALVVEATAPVFDVKVAGHEFTAPQPLRVTLRNGRIEFDSFTLQRPDSVFSLTGFAEITGAKRLDLDVRGRIDAAIVQLFMSDVRAEGTSDLALSIAGTLDAPTLRGSAELIDAEVKFAGFPQLIDEINGTLRFTGDRLQIDSLRATVGGGSVVAAGFVTLNGLTPDRIRITLQGDDVALRYYEGVTVEGDFTLLLTGDLERQLLQGDVAVTRALYFRDFDVQQALLEAILARDRVTTVTAEEDWQSRLGLRIHLTAPGTLAVRNNLAELSGSATLDVSGTLANPIVLGEVTLDEGGSLRIQNVDYRLTRGTIAFQNPFRIDPFLDITIEGTVSGGASELEGGPLDITVNLTGTLDRLSPTITSDPPASDITLFSILGFGGLGSRSTQQTGGAGLLGQSLLYQSLSSLIGSRVFPFVDAFAYDPGDAGAGPGAKVTFEKRLSNKVRFLVVYNLDNSQSREVIEWLVNRDWTLQLTRDETDEYRVDARFRRRYDARWELGGDDREIAQAAVMRSPGAEGTQTTADQAGLVGALPVTTVEPHAFAGATVSQVNFRADAAFDTSTLAQEVTVAPGRAVSMRELQSSIKNLFATGNFRDVRVDARPSTGTPGVVVTFSLFLHYRIGEITIEGISGGDRSRAARELDIHTGEVLSLDSVDDNATSLQDSLRRKGWLAATVDPETNFDRARNRADIILHVTPGPLAQVGSVVIEGDIAPFTPAQLIERMKGRPGRSFALQNARDDANRMRNFLVRRDYRRARVELVANDYDAATNQVTLRYRATTGPLVKVEVTGVSRRSVRHWLPFGKNQEYSEDVIDRAADDITRSLQQRGYFLATVDTESELEGNVWTTTFHVDPGTRYRLTDVAFDGNVKLSDKRLRGAVETSASGGFRRFLMTLFRRPTGVTREQLSDDRDALESLYHLEGFAEATVGTPAVETRADGTMRATFPVTEGPQTLVTTVRIEGNETRNAGELPRPALEPGAPLNPQTVRADVVALQAYYAERGHTEIQVRPRIELNADKTSAAVVYVIAEGPAVKVDEVIVRGNTYTDRDVILRKAEIDPGDPFSYTSILEAQRELYRLGIFNRVEIQPEQAGTSVSDRDVVIEVEEGKNLTLVGGIGLRAQRGGIGSGIELHERIAGAIAHRNLFGTGRYLGLEAVYSHDQQEASLTFREPYVSKWNVPVQLQIFQSDDATRPDTQFLQRGTSIELTKVARARTRWSLRYEYKISKCEGGEICDELRAGEVPDIDRSLADIQISSITPTFFWDTRDDLINPHRGFFTSASIEHAAPLFSATAHFFKEYLQGAYYLPVSQRTVLAFAGRLGMIQPLGGTTDADVPLSEKFTAGGETTHRAFRLDLLGELCKDEDFQDIPGCEPTLFRKNPDSPTLPKGGSGLLLFNAEYRFPIVGTFGGAIFADAGNVYRSDNLRLDKLRYGVGVGFRYLSPVGPLRVDIGWPIDRKPFEDAFQYFITLGYPF